MENIYLESLILIVFSGYPTELLNEIVKLDQKQHKVFGLRAF